MKVKFRKWEGGAQWSHYSETGETALMIYSAEDGPIAKATVCLYPPSPRAGPDEVWLKTWGEGDGLPEALVEAGVVILTDRFERAGHGLAQLAKLTPESLAEIEAFYASRPDARADRDRARATGG